MALSNASIPVQVSGLILETLKSALAYARHFNEDYQGEVTPGASLKIPSIGSVTVSDYARYTDITAQEAADSAVTLNVDKQKYFSILLDDVDAIQAKPGILTAYTIEAVFALRKQIDADLAATLAAGGTLTAGLGSGTTPIEVNSKNIAGQLMLMARLLDDASVPRANRVVTLPPWAIEKLTLASIVDSTDNAPTLAEGIVGRYAGFDIGMSQSVPNTAGAKFKIIASAPLSATMALQLQNVESIRHPTMFADNLRGLAVYGSVCTRPATIAVGTWNQAAEA